MTNKNDIIKILSERHYHNFVECASTKIIELDANIEELYKLATDQDLNMPKAQKQNIIFRSAYILEYIYFNYPDLFYPFIERFICDYPNCKNASAQRHFTKMMADLLKKHKFNGEQINFIAEATTLWVSDPKTKVAVKVWAMHILNILKSDLLWLSEIWNDLEELMKNDASPAMLVRIRRNWQ